MSIRVRLMAEKSLGIFGVKNQFGKCLVTRNTVKTLGNVWGFGLTYDAPNVPMLVQPPFTLQKGNREATGRFRRWI
jgi:hypothetical protein